MCKNGARRTEGSWVKALATTHDNPSAIPRTYMVESKENKLSSDLHKPAILHLDTYERASIYRHKCTHECTYTHTDNGGGAPTRSSHIDPQYPGGQQAIELKTRHPSSNRDAKDGQMYQKRSVSPAWRTLRQRCQVKSSALARNKGIIQPATFVG